MRINAFWVRDVEPKTGKLVRFATLLFLALVLVSQWKTLRQVANGLP